MEKPQFKMWLSFLTEVIFAVTSLAIENAIRSKEIKMKKRKKNVMK